MRYLNKLVFIHSATIPYAEVHVNGNVHLIGTQGVGKSTLLRALLFFYNADTQKLGIPREKKNFSEYYFPYQNSYIVYEVIRETGAYCVVAFKSQGKVCFRFADTAYENKYFIDNDGRAFENWDETRRLLDADGVLYSGKIDRYESYRDIIYGNSDNSRKDWARYALLESRQYQNIPRTIQNVFLNSKLDAEFIKQTIILSLDEEEISVDLDKYRHHLRGFDEQMRDIGVFRQSVVQKLASKIVQQHQELGFREMELQRTAQHLAWAAAQVAQQAPKIKEKISKTEQELQTLEEKLEALRERYDKKARTLAGEMSVLRANLKTARQKETTYGQMGIQSILERMTRKPALEVVLNAARMELAIRTEKQGAITQRYEALLQTQENEYQQQMQLLEQQRFNNQSALMSRKEELRTQSYLELEQLTQATERTLAKVNDLLQERGEALQEEKLRRENVRHRRYREQDIRSIQEQIQSLELSVKEAKQKLEQIQVEEDQIRKQAELDEATAVQRLQSCLDALATREKEAAKALQEVIQKLDMQEDALYGWLQNHLPGWEETIGKVADESLLFLQGLEPTRTDAADALYGVQLRLDAVPSKVKTLAGYEAEKTALEETLQQIATERNRLKADLEEEKEKIRKKHSTALRACRDTAHTLRFSIDRDEQQADRERLALKDLRKVADQEQKEALAAIDEPILDAIRMFEEVKQQRQELLEEKNRKAAAIKRETERRVKEAEKESQSETQRIDEEKATIDTQHNAKREALLVARNQELEGQGIDTREVEKLERNIRDTEEELAFIDRNRELVANYHKDKKELIDQQPVFKKELDALEGQQAQEDQKFAAQQEKLRKEKAEIQERQKTFEEDFRMTQEDLEAFQRFAAGELWNGLDSTFRQEREAFRTDKRCKTLIDDLNRLNNSLHRLLEDFRENNNRFLGSFSANNIFAFPAQLTGAEDYRRFAVDLDEFLSSSKIEEFERRVNSRFANIIRTIGKDTDRLLSKEYEIRKVINDINRDFATKNFVTAIQKIELRVDESGNSVVRLLMLIKSYNDEHPFDLGGMNLFSSVDQEANNRKAVDLLMQLSRLINDLKQDKISLNDTFELRFRIEENQNDSGWVEKLANVGSEGTDVLVKAMINIMLLNVFKENASRKFKAFSLHCMMDEIGRLHPNNVKGILQFANDRNINLINGSPTATNALDYKHIYRLERDAQRNTRIHRIITNHALA
ncbi:MAG: ATP-binding protein [Chitinophagaceae bacterium]|nr:MAG: ATP-binding protein [Chitinophagaceae bacterium]